MSRVLALSGSLRAGSFNTQLLRALPALAPEGMEFEFFDGMADIPLYNQDLDVDPPPPAVAKLRDAIRAADGIVLATPEYLHALPGVVKNALDWASRPPADPALTGKGVVVLVATIGRTFGFRSLAEAHQVFTHLRNVVVPAPEVVVNTAHEVLVTDEDGTARITDPMAVALVQVQLHMLADLLASGAASAVSDALDRHTGKLLSLFNAKSG
ncbi:NADPH-dependent FMN reductase [Lentzea sp. NPDC059081]|uniref:NADPH-dependent FMN reductase n=1 Tax=Lentzea sp. NPDC059081 TaxID=3346719 RepID=UPI0036AB248E